MIVMRLIVLTIMTLILVMGVRCDVRGSGMRLNNMLNGGMVSAIVAGRTMESMLRHIMMRFTYIVTHSHV